MFWHTLRGKTVMGRLRSGFQSPQSVLTPSQLGMGSFNLPGMGLNDQQDRNLGLDNFLVSRYNRRVFITGYQEGLND